MSYNSIIVPSGLLALPASVLADISSSVRESSRIIAYRIINMKDLLGGIEKIFVMEEKGGDEC